MKNELYCGQGPTFPQYIASQYFISNYSSSLDKGLVSRKFEDRLSIREKEHLSFFPGYQSHLPGLIFPYQMVFKFSLYVQYLCNVPTASHILDIW